MIRTTPNIDSYPFCHGMSKQEQSDAVQSLQTRWLEDRQFIVRDGGIRRKNNQIYENLDQIPTIRESIEIAYRDSLQVSLQDLLQAYSRDRGGNTGGRPDLQDEARGFLFLDLFRHVLDNPLSFFSALSPKRYADKPFSELVQCGSYKVMLGFYELAHGNVPSLPTEEAEKNYIIQEQDRIHKGEGAIENIQWVKAKEYDYLLPLIQEWVEGIRAKLENLSHAKTQLTLEEIVTWRELPFRAIYLQALWISVVKVPLAFATGEILPLKIKEQTSEECPYDLSRLTTVKQQERFFFVYQKSRSIQSIKDKFGIGPAAWQDFVKAINNKLKDCEIKYNSDKKEWEVLPFRES